TTILQSNKLTTNSPIEVISNERFIFIENGQSHYVRLIELQVDADGIESKPTALISEFDYRIFKQWNNIKSAHAVGPGG
ncbi:hypothetical protein ACKI1O_53500, partial [Streptomyces scabiei]